MGVTKTTQWYGIDICKSCHEVLTDTQVMWSSGVCPHCGHCSGSTVCNYIKVIVRRTTVYSGFLLLKTTKTYEGKDAFSKEWLLKRTV